MGFSGIHLGFKCTRDEEIDVVFGPTSVKRNELAPFEYVRFVIGHARDKLNHFIGRMAVSFRPALLNLALDDGPESLQRTLRAVEDHPFSALDVTLNVI